MTSNLTVNPSQHTGFDYAKKMLGSGAPLVPTMLIILFSGRF
jgi:hypothetical protein